MASTMRYRGRPANPDPKPPEPSEHEKAGGWSIRTWPWPIRLPEPHREEPDE